MSETFREWVAGQGGNKNLISFAGRIYPIIRNRVEEELGRNLKDISQQVAEAFCDACTGTTLEAGTIKGLWEFQLSPVPVNLGSRRLHIGSLVIGYQFPAEAAKAANKMGPDEREKFIRERSKHFQDFLKSLSTDSDKLGNIAEELVDRLHKAVEDKLSLEGNKAAVIWSQPITTNKGTKNLGSLVVAHRLSPVAEQELEKALNSAGPAATDSIANTPQ